MPPEPHRRAGENNPGGYRAPYRSRWRRAGGREPASRKVRANLRQDVADAVDCLGSRLAGAGRDGSRSGGRGGSTGAARDEIGRCDERCLRVALHGRQHSVQTRVPVDVWHTVPKLLRQPVSDVPAKLPEQVRSVCRLSRWPVRRGTHRFRATARRANRAGRRRKPSPAGSDRAANCAAVAPWLEIRRSRSRRSP